MGTARKSARLESLLTPTNLAIGLVFGVSILITALPYFTSKPAVPFGSDMQHPQALLKLLETGAPLSLYPDYLNQQYPNTYGYLLASVAKLLRLEPLFTVSLVTTLCMVASLGAVYVFARQLYGKQPAVFALMAYGLLSFQPRQTFLDGTRIELVSGLVLAPLCLMALHHTLLKPGYRWGVVAGILFGALIRYHFIGTVQAGIVTVVFLALLLIFRRDLLTRGAFLRLFALMGIAALFSLPYSIYYFQIALKIGLGRLGFLPVAAEQEAVFPPIGGFDEILSRLGLFFFVFGLFALGGLLGARFTARKTKAQDLLMLAWLVMLCIGSFTPALLVPERFLRNFSLPLSILIGVFLALLKQRRHFAPALVAALIVLCAPYAISSVVYHGTQTVYATADDLPSLYALRYMAQRDTRVTLSDDSGVWMPYFAGDNSRYIAGGLEGFMWYGEPLRSEMRELWSAHLDPCAPGSPATFAKYDIGFVYVGAQPEHWTMPGYIHVDGGAYLACPDFKKVYQQNAPNGSIYIFERLPARPPLPAWAPPEGITPQNALNLSPTLPADGSSDESYFRLWHRNVALATMDVTGLSSSNIVSHSLASPGASSEWLLKEASALRRAAQAGVKGNPNAPYAEFKLFLVFGQPDTWPPNNLPYTLALDKTIELPRDGMYTPAIQWWYAANRAKYNTVYYGVSDPDPSVHTNWAKTHSDVDLYNEIMALWSAAQDGVTGSQAEPRKAYDAWLSRKLAK